MVYGSCFCGTSTNLNLLFLYFSAPHSVDCWAYQISLISPAAICSSCWVGCSQCDSTNSSRIWLEVSQDDLSRQPLLTFVLNHSAISMLIYSKQSEPSRETTLFFFSTTTDSSWSVSNKTINSTRLTTAITVSNVTHVIKQISKEIRPCDMWP